MAFTDVVLEAREEEIISHLLQGKSVLQAAKDMGYDVPNAIYRITNRAEFKKKFRQRLQQVYNLTCPEDLVEKKQKLQLKLQDEAENLVDEIIMIAKTSPKEGSRLAAAKAALELTTGLGFDNKQQNAGGGLVLNADIIQIAMQAGREIKKSDVEIVNQEDE